MTSLILAALTMVTNLFLLRLEKDDKVDQARRWNQVALIGFPASYILSYVLIWFVFI